jgi:hypothetical protein
MSSSVHIAKLQRTHLLGCVLKGKIQLPIITKYACFPVQKNVAWTDNVKGAAAESQCNVQHFTFKVQKPLSSCWCHIIVM